MMKPHHMMAVKETEKLIGRSAAFLEANANLAMWSAIIALLQMARGEKAEPVPWMVGDNGQVGLPLLFLHWATGLRYRVIRRRAQKWSKSLFRGHLADAAKDMTWDRRRPWECIELTLIPMVLYDLDPSGCQDATVRADTIAAVRLGADCVKYIYAHPKVQDKAKELDSIAAALEAAGTAGVLN